MKVVSVIPIKKGLFLDTLTYFTSQDMALGTIISISVRSQELPAIVTKIDEVSLTKSEIKDAPFALRKIKPSKEGSRLPESVIRAAQKTADWHAVPIGTILRTLLPKPFLDYAIGTQWKSDALDAHPHVTPLKWKILNASREERESVYKHLVREAIAQKERLLIVVPTIPDLERAEATIVKGISSHVVYLHSELGKRAFHLALERINSGERGLIVCATPTFATIPIHHLHRIIIEEEGSAAHMSFSKPNIDVRRFLTHLAQELSIEVMSGGGPVRPETHLSLINGQALPYHENRSRVLSSAETLIENMKKKPISTQMKAPFRIFSKETIDRIRRELDAQGRVFIFGPRKGMASQTACSDCGSVLSCTNCLKPLVLYKQSGFRCNHCGESMPADTPCPTCTSWKLTPLGIGLDRIEEELIKEFPRAPRYRMESDTITSHAKAKQIVEEFEGSEGAIAFGTEMGLYYFRQKVGVSVIATIDPLFSLPYFRIHEKIFSIITKIRDTTERTVIIQTRLTEDPLIAAAARGAMNEYLTAELSERKTWGYPPYKRFIKVSESVKKVEVSALIEKRQELFKQWEPDSYAGGITKEQLYPVHTLIRLHPDDWPNQALIELLTSLGPKVQVAVDPDELL